MGIKIENTVNIQIKASPTLVLRFKCKQNHFLYFWFKLSLSRA